MQDKILCVDDEPCILDGFRRLLRKQFDLTTCTSGMEALAVLEEQGPFAVVVSDMNMPGMDGIEFLAKTRELAPDSVRMMLTGKADLQVATDAVNEGNIFRFLTKPCDPEGLSKALRLGCEQYRLITAERELLEKTLKGSVKVLVDMMSLTNPVIFSRASRLQSYAVEVAKAAKVSDLWQLEVAAMLSEIGCITIPEETLKKFFAGEDLSEVEQEMINAYPETGRQIVGNIPRLEPVAEMIVLQHYPEEQLAEMGEFEESIITGASILKMVRDFDMLISRGIGRRVAVDHLTQSNGRYRREFLETLRRVEIVKSEMVVRMCEVSELNPGMFLEQDVVSSTGTLVLPKGHLLDSTMCLRLRNFFAQGVIGGHVRVSISDQ